MMYLRRCAAIEQPTRGGVRRQVREEENLREDQEKYQGKAKNEECDGRGEERGRERKERYWFSPFPFEMREVKRRERRKERVLWTGRRTTGGFWAVQMRGERS
jgi:hypothetical protein